MRSLKIIIALFVFVISVSSSIAQPKDVIKGMEYFEYGEWQLAKDYLRDGYTKIKSDKKLKAEVTFMVAECYNNMKNSRVAEVWYLKAIKRHYGDPVVYLRYADMLKMNEDYEDAVVQYKKYVEKVPNDDRGPYGVESCELAAVWKKNPTRHEVEAMAYFNDSEADFAPAYAKKDYKIVYFTSSREGAIGDKLDKYTGINYTDIFMTSLDRKGKWSIPVPVGPPVNTEFSEGGTCLNKRANTLYFSRCPFDKRENLGCRIYTAKKRGLGWGDPTEIPIGPDSVSIKYPTLSQDEKTLYFVADLPGGYGDMDIWMVKRPKRTKNFGDPINLGPEINTFGTESYPFTHDDSTLYFSSNQHLGMGGHDIFEAKLQKDGKWEVKNMQYPINTSTDDVGFIRQRKRPEGFFASKRSGGKGSFDIYYWEIPALKFSSGGLIVKSKDDTPIVGAKVKLLGDNGFMLEMDSEADGSYLFKNIPEDGDYTVSAIVDGYLLNKFEFSTKGVNENKYWTSNIVLELIPLMTAIDIPDIFYDFNKATLRPESMVAMDSLVMFLEDNIKITVELMSHTDRVGNDESNNVLSNRRAKSVVDYLVSKGIEKERLTWKGYGESIPHTVSAKHAAQHSFLKDGDILSEDYIDDLGSKEQKDVADQINRRTQFQILSDDFETKLAPKAAPVYKDPYAEDDIEDEEN
ncbi:MAG: OmpA family protein [Bacteroidota bacterium]|nr:OmpA family protein [Bacteroidota bacterium]